VSTVQYYVRGVDFPAEKEEVAQAAESNGAPQDMVAQIRGAAADRIGGPEEVMQALQSGLDRGSAGLKEGPGSRGIPAR
jgi:hypothetical protein